MQGRVVIIGSGETAPTMVKTHREVLARTGGGLSVLLDTPYGFQVNADDLTDKIGTYFRESVGQPLDVARWRRRDEGVAERERALELIGRASWVFTGPGSPSYALAHWGGTAVPGALLDVIRRGGTLVMGSAAAVTIGAFALPVYEIYKVGLDPYWSEGLGLLQAAAGIRAAVVPHFDNREGGRHDTRFCYIGEQRLVALERDLPPDVGVLGVDEHTAVVIDLEAGTASVAGAGVLTLRHRDHSTVVAAEESIDLESVRRLLAGERSTASGSAPVPTVTRPGTEGPSGGGTAEPPSLRAEALRLRGECDACLAAGDADGALAAVLTLEETIRAWSQDTLQGDDLDVARAQLRGMIVALGGAAQNGLVDRRDVIAPVVDVALQARARARQDKDFAMSDLLRDGLAAAGVEVRDTPTGQEWHLT